MTRARASIVGALLAGGRARRMGGGDKSLLPLGGQAMLAHCLQRLAPQVGEVVLSANGNPARFSAFGLPVVSDVPSVAPPGQGGPLAGIFAIMDWCRRNRRHVTHIVSLPGDTPFAPRNLVTTLEAATRESATSDRRFTGIVLARSATGLHPAVGLWPLTATDDLGHALIRGTRKILNWTAEFGQREAHFDSADDAKSLVAFDPFFNVNRPDDAKEAERLLTLAQRGSG